MISVIETYVDVESKSESLDEVGTLLNSTRVNGVSGALQVSHTLKTG